MKYVFLCYYNICYRIHLNYKLSEEKITCICIIIISNMFILHCFVMDIKLYQIIL